MTATASRDKPTEQDRTAQLSTLVENARAEEDRLRADPKATPEALVAARQTVIAAEQALAGQHEHIERTAAAQAEQKAEAQHEATLDAMAALAKDGQATADELRGVLRKIAATLSELGPQGRAALASLSEQRREFQRLGSELVPGFGFLNFPRGWTQAQEQAARQAMEDLWTALEERKADPTVLRSPITYSQRPGVADVTNRQPLYPVETPFDALAWQAVHGPKED